MSTSVRATIMRAAGGAVAYGALAAFVAVVAMQSYRWLREGEWPHFGLSDGLRALLGYCCVKDGDAGRLAAFARWLDAPTDWLGWHKVLDVIPASIGLFALSVLGNFVRVHGNDLSAAADEEDGR